MGINVRLNSSTTVRAYNAPLIPSPYSILSGYASTAGVSTSVIGGIGSITRLSVSGISTLGITSTTNLTAQNINNSGITTTNSLSIGSTQVISSARQLQNIASLDATTTATIESAVSNAPNTFTDLNITGISTLGVTSTTNLTAQQLNISGVSTFAGISTLQSSLFGTQGSFTGIVTANSFRPSSGYYQSPNGTNAFYVFDTSGDVSFQGKIVTNYIRSNTNLSPTITVSDLDLQFARNINISGITTSTGGFVGNASGTNLNYSGISTLGNVTVGAGNTTMIVNGTVMVTGVSTFTGRMSGSGFDASVIPYSIALGF
jgi:hypothetical protein